MKNKLSREYIKTLAEGPKVKSVAVYNFLGTLPPNTTQKDDTMNLAMDAKMYQWNRETVRAIGEGIHHAFSGQE